MSLSLAVISNTLSPLVSKSAFFIQAKSAELATAAGSLLLAAGILLGTHAMSNLHASARQISQTTSDENMLSSKEANFQMAKQRLRQVEEDYQRHRGEPIVNTHSITTGYRVVQNTARALLADLPHYAARDGITLASVTTGDNHQSKGFSALPVAGYPGVMQVVFDIAGNYTTLNGLQQFFAGLPPATTLTGITINGTAFTAEVGAYGLAS